MYMIYITMYQVHTKFNFKIIIKMQVYMFYRYMNHYFIKEYKIYVLHIYIYMLLYLYFIIIIGTQIKVRLEKSPLYGTHMVHTWYKCSVLEERFHKFNFDQLNFTGRCLLFFYRLREVLTEIM